MKSMLALIILTGCWSPDEYVAVRGATVMDVAREINRQTSYTAMLVGPDSVRRYSGGGPVQEVLDTMCRLDGCTWEWRSRARTILIVRKEAQ